jgi:peroxiredoxin
MFNAAIVAVPLVAAGAFLFYLGVIQPREARAIVNAFQVRTGQPVPALILVDTLGERLSLAKAVLGQPTLVVVMDPECAHCHTELQAIRTILDRTPPARRPRVVGVSVGRSDLLQDAARRYPGIPLYDDVGGAVQTRLGLRMVPAHFSVAADGRVSEVRVGLQSEPYLAGVMSALTR